MSCFQHNIDIQVWSLYLCKLLGYVSAPEHYVSLICFVDSLLRFFCFFSVISQTIYWLASKCRYLPSFHSFQCSCKSGLAFRHYGGCMRKENSLYIRLHYCHGFTFCKKCWLANLPRVFSIPPNHREKSHPLPQSCDRVDKSRKIWFSLEIPMLPGFWSYDCTYDRIRCT